jgi:hypothetical protein
MSTSPRETPLFDEWETLVGDCEARESRLNDWEKSFVQSVGEQVRGRRALTTKQSDLLDDIWSRATEKG